MRRGTRSDPNVEHQELPSPTRRSRQSRADVQRQIEQLNNSIQESQRVIESVEAQIQQSQGRRQPDPIGSTASRPNRSQLQHVVEEPEHHQQSARFVTPVRNQQTNSTRGNDRGRFGHASLTTSTPFNTPQRTVRFELPEDDEIIPELLRIDRHDGGGDNYQQNNHLDRGGDGVTPQGTNDTQYFTPYRTVYSDPVRRRLNVNQSNQRQDYPAPLGFPNNLGNAHDHPPMNRRFENVQPERSEQNYQAQQPQFPPMDRQLDNVQNGRAEQNQQTQRQQFGPTGNYIQQDIYRNTQHNNQVEHDQGYGATAISASTPTVRNDDLLTQLLVERLTQPTSTRNEELMTQLVERMTQMSARQTEAYLWYFDGTSCLDWPLFRLRYTTICDEGGYSGNQRVAKLDKFLRVPARNFVDIALKTSSDAEPILKALDRVYGRPENIKAEIERKIAETLTVDDWRDFSQFGGAVKNFAIAATFLKGKTTYTRGFMEKMLAKLPQHLMVQFCEYCSKMSIPEGDEELKHLDDWVDTMNRVMSLVPFNQTLPAPPSASSSVQNPPPPKKQLEHSQHVCQMCKGSCKSLNLCQKFLEADVKIRKRIQESSGACWMCLQTHKGRCNNAKMCGLNGCTKYHHQLIHKDPEQIEQSHGCTVVRNPTALLKLLPVIIYGPQGCKEILAFMDDGCTSTMLDDSVARELGLSGPHSPLTYLLAGQMSVTDKDSMIVQAEISGCLPGMKHEKLRNIRTVSSVDIPAQSPDWGKLMIKYPYLEIINSEKIQTRPQLIIGQSNAHLLERKTSIQPSVDQPAITRTVLGWVAHGPIADPQEQAECAFSCNEITNEELHELVKKNFALDDMISSAKVQRRTKEEDKALSVLTKTIRYEGGKYVLRLPWKADNPEFPDTYPMARKRMMLIESKLKENPELAAAYQAEIRKLLDNEYAELVSVDELRSADRVWYLPHFFVLNPNKPGKVRLVFDCAAKVQGKSLNDYLLTGPDLLNSMFGILLRFRKHDVAWTSDVMEMFNRINIDYNDSFSQLFLWRDLDQSKPPQVYRMKAMLFGATCSPFLSQFTKNFNAECFEDEYPEAASESKTEIFMDDWVSGAADEQTAIKIIHEVNEIQLHGNFTLRNYVSNSKAVLNSLDDDIKATKNEAQLLTDKSENRVLGILWNADTDRISFQTNFHKVKPEIIQGLRSPTKREILSCTMSLFNPSGELAPITIKPRILLQDLWHEGIHWDDPIKGSLLERWKACLKHIQKIRDVTIPRRYCPHLHQADNIQLHTFCDASEEAYCAVVYLRVRVKDQIHVSLVSAKAKVAPRAKGRLKLTIPRLELLAALLGVRLSTKVLDELKLPLIHSLHFWSDSKTVVIWIQSKKSINRFVDCRLHEILNDTTPPQWNWIESKRNPADVATREKTDVNMTSDCFWFAPPLLRQDDVIWAGPARNQVLVIDEPVELVNFHKEIETNSHHTEISLPQIKFNHSLLKLLKITARLRHIIENLKSRSWEYRKIRPEDMNWAEYKWYEAVQAQCFAIDIENLRRKKRNRSGRLHHIAIELGADNLLRTKSRLQFCAEAQIRCDGQIVLDGDHEFTKKLLESYHIKMHHRLFEATINEIQRKYYVPNLRSKLKMVISSCKKCHRETLKASEVVEGPIPDLRLMIYQKPFYRCGVDYMGPFYITQGRARIKVYGCLFSDMTARGIELDIVPDLTSSSVINAIRRLMATYGAVDCFYSDNATNFRGASRELKEALEHLDMDQVEEYTSARQIKWKFNPPYTPHLGGAWERLIGVVKRSIEATMEERCVSYDSLRTIFAEAKHIVNSRPLTFVSTREGEEAALTPNDLLIHRNIEVGMPGTFGPQELGYGRRWRVVQVLADMFWKRFISEYTNTLKNVKKWKHNNPEQIELGEVVIVRQGQLPRSVWPLAIVTNLKTGRDGVTRVVELRLANKKRIERHVRDLFRLGIKEGQDVDVLVSTSHPQDEATVDTAVENVNMSLSIPLQPGLNHQSAVEFK